MTVNAPLKTLSLAQAAAFLERSPRWVQLVASQGWIQRDRRGSYGLVGLVRGALAYYEDLIAKREASAGSNKATDTRAHEIELRIEARLAELIWISDAEAELDTTLEELRQELTGFERRVHTTAENRNRIRLEVEGVIARAEAAVARAKVAIRTGEDLV